MDYPSNWGAPTCKDETKNPDNKQEDRSKEHDNKPKEKPKKPLEKPNNEPNTCTSKNTVEQCGKCQSTDQCKSGFCCPYMKKCVTTS